VHATEADDEDVSLADEFVQRSTVLWLPGIEGCRSATGCQGELKKADITDFKAGYQHVKRIKLQQLKQDGLRTMWRVHFDHLCTKLGELAADNGASNDPDECNDLDTGEGAMTIPLGKG
jgi:hypothetical protein